MYWYSNESSDKLRDLGLLWKKFALLLDAWKHVDFEQS